MRLLTIAIFALLMFPATTAFLTDTPINAESDDVLIATESPAVPESALAPHDVATTPAASVAADESGHAVAMDENKAQPPVADAPPTYATPQEQLAAFLDEIDADFPSKSMLRLMAQPNGTNGTVLNETGTHSHKHEGVGGDGIYSVWAATFYGETRIMAPADVDGDGLEDVLLGTNVGLTAVSSTGTILWHYPLGNEVRTLEYDADSNQILYATLWQAQLGEVGLLDAATGEPVVKITDTAHFVSAALHDDGFLVATVDGFVVKYDDFGDEIWRYDTRLIPDTVAVVAFHVNLGTYHAEAADFDGDGIRDMAVATLNYRSAGLLAGTFEAYTQIHAVNGATGNLLWITMENADPVIGFSANVITDMTAVDTRGDGSMDLAYGSFTYRFYYVPFAVSQITYESSLRAIDGSSDRAPVLLGSRTLMTPVLPLEMYGDIEAVDANGDGQQEVAVLRFDLASALLNGEGPRMESYSFIPHAPGQAASMVLSDVVFLNGDAPTLSTYEGNGIEVFLGSTVDTSGVAIPSTLAGESVLQFNAPPLLATLVNGEVVVATKGELVLPGAVTPLRGLPTSIVAGHFDGDVTPDFFVHSTDGHVYALDGLNGQVISSIRVGTGSIVAVEDVNFDGRDDLIMTLEVGFDDQLRAQDATGKTLWSVEYNQFSIAFGNIPMFDGNGDGVTDYLIAMNGFSDGTRAINGRDGSTLWSKEYRQESSLYPFFRDASAIGSGAQDLLTLSYKGYARIDGKTGNLDWDIQDEDYIYTGCIGEIATGSGTAPYVLYDSFDGVQSKARIGNTWKNVDLFDAAGLSSCQVTSMGDETLVSARYYTEDFNSRAGFARVNSNGTVWNQWGGVAEYNQLEVFGIDANANTVYMAWEDHVRAMDWSTGDVVADFTFNGPFVRSGDLTNLDGFGAMEVAALASNGILWILSEDDDVHKTLANRAQDEGKPVLTNPEGIPVNEVDEETPFLAAPFVLLGLLWLARRR
ncbi:MAG: PQQ-binding-like beta-propeller repeat protein [Thermoplasmatota archaeon]